MQPLYRVMVVICLIGFGLSDLSAASTPSLHASRQPDLILGAAFPLFAAAVTRNEAGSDVYHVTIFAQVKRQILHRTLCEQDATSKSQKFAALIYIQSMMIHPPHSFIRKVISSRNGYCEINISSWTRQDGNARQSMNVALLIILGGVR